jgi:hypothetical protein
MTALPAGVPLEECAGLLQQVGRHGQVNLGVRQAVMPEVNREVIDQPLHVGTLSVPLGQAVDREGVPKVVQPRLEATTVGALDTGTFSQSLEGTR